MANIIIHLMLLHRNYTEILSLIGKTVKAETNSHTYCLTEFCLAGASKFACARNLDEACQKSSLHFSSLPEGHEVCQ